MRKSFSRVLAAGAVTLLGLGLLAPVYTYADEESQDSASEDAAKSTGTSISLTPVSKILQLSSSSTYEDKFTVSNDGSAPLKIEVYAAPYSYVYSNEEDAYKLGFNKENNFTQITRWITFKDDSGNYVKKPTFTIDPNSALDIEYKVTTPDNIPAGGQYAVIFAHTLSSATSENGIKTEASPGLVVYGRSTEGEATIAAEISDMKIEQSVTENGTTRNNFYASAKVKNIGNVDFNASGVLKVDSIIGGGSYETPATGGRVSVIPDSELVVSDEWEETPSFGLYKATWTVTAGEQTEVTERIIFLMSPAALIISIILLTIIIVGIIIMVRKRKERRSRLAV